MLFNMRISALLFCVACAALCATAQAASAAANNKTATKDDPRGKRDLDIDNYGSYHNSPPAISKRIATGYQNYAPPQDFFTPPGNPYHSAPPANVYDPLFNGGADEYVRDFDSHGQNYINDYRQHPGPLYQPQPQYLEAPEPIIEIIIKESNETLPALEPPPTQQPQKKKKEEVQVFYVKYKKDEHNGVVIDDPVAALSPPSYHQENDDGESDDEEESGEQLPEALPYQLPATEAPPQRTTTLRTIIHPDSERFHSNSGIQVTFNSEDKSEAVRHHYQEHIEESAVQPIVAVPQSPQPPPQHQPRQQQFHVAQQQQQQQQQHQQQTFQQQQFQQFNQQNRFEVRKPAPPQNTFPHPPQAPHPQFAPQLPLHQELPRPQFSSQPFREFVQHQPPPQQLQHQQPPQRFFDQPQFAPHQYRPPFAQPPQPQQPLLQPKQRVPQPVVPIPLYNIQQQQLPKQNRPQQFYHQAPAQQQQQQQQQQQPQQPQQQHQSHPQPQPQPQPQIKPQPHPQQQQQHQPPPPQQQQPHFTGTRAPSQQSSLAQYRVRQQPQPQQPQQHYSQSQIQGGGLVVQNAPNLAGTQPSSAHPVGQDFVNKVITGAELVASVPKYEQHITQSVPFGQPIRPFDVPSNAPNGNYHVEQQQQQPQQQQPQHQQQQQHHRFQQQAQQSQQEPQFVPKQQPILTHFSQPLPQTLPQPQPQQSVYRHETTVETFTASQSDIYAQQQQQQQQHQPQQKKPQPQHHSQYTPNVQPGHSVSTLASDVLPALANQQKHSQQQQQQQQQHARHRPTYADNDDFVPSIEQYRKPVPPTTSTTTTTTTARPTTTTAATTKKPSRAQFELPDEVPDDLRAQLLSSGILDNADISVLDYDKVGDVPLESLPPEHLANFYGGGGAAQISSSNKVVTVVKPNGDHVHTKKHSAKDTKPVHIVSAVTAEPAEQTTVAPAPEKTTTLPTHRHNVDLKVVRFDSVNQKSVTDAYIRPDATVLPTVELSPQDQQYNRYLPLKVSGAQFPVPDVPELRGRRISSVVVLAPVDNVQSTESSAAASDSARYERDLVEDRQIRFVAGEPLKQLLKKPTKENFKRWLEREAHTELDLQSVVLLVTENELDDEDSSPSKEIFMYDIATQHANRLSGELSSAFVNVAEENAGAQDINTSAISDSGIVQQMAAAEGAAQRRSDDDINDAAEEFEEEEDDDSVGVQSEQRPLIVSAPPLQSILSLGGAGDGKANRVQINSGYSVIN